MKIKNAVPRVAASWLGRAALLACVALVLGSCGDSQSGGPRQLVSLNVQPGNAQAIPPDGTIPFSAIGTFNQAPTSQSNLPVQWASSDSTIAQVDPNTGIAQCVAFGGPVSIVASAAGQGGTVTASAELACFSPDPAAKLDPPSLAEGCTVRFGRTCGCVTSETTSLTNVGDQPLDVANITVKSGIFSQTNNCGSSLNTGQSCTITVEFRLRAMGNFHDELVIADNAPDSPQMVSLSGVNNCTP
jgi:hypothetical protein